jgi:hypothetical protein
MEPVFPQRPTDTPRPLILLLDAVDQMVLASELHYDRLLGALLRYGSLTDSAPAATKSDDAHRELKRAQVEIVADLGGFIGTIHRLRRLMDRFPGDRGARPLKKEFIASVCDLEVARHRLEHLEKAIFEPLSTSEGAFGAISWWRIVDEHTIVLSFLFPGTATKEAEAINRRPTSMKGPVDHVWARVAGQDIQVTETYLAVVKLEDGLRQWGTSQAAQGWPSLATRRERNKPED